MGRDEETIQGDHPKRMLRDVRRILKKHLKEAYLREVEETAPDIGHSPWEMLVGYPKCIEEDSIRELSHELIQAIRGIKDVDLIRIPDKEEVVNFLRGIYPGDMVKDEGFEDFVDFHADVCLKWMGKL